MLPMIADWYFGSDDWQVFFVCIIVTAFFGGAMILATYGHNLTMNIKQAFLMTVSCWVVLSIFGALPFYFSSLDMSITDSFFEAMSGITTTGSTVIVGLDHAPAGILFWRSILQWLGGVGIIIMAMSILPFLNVGGMQIFRTELSETEKALPRATQLASSIGMIYVALTFLCSIFYMATGFEVFDAVAHAMTTISTGGFSTFDSSFSHYESFAPQIVAIVFMILGGMPFVLYLKAVRGNIFPLLRDSQVKWFLSIIFITTTMISLWLIFHENHEVAVSIVDALFNVVSLITGTGFASHDYGGWGIFAIGILFFLMLVGGCVGSTSCGIKIFRFQVLYEICRIQIKRLLYPNGMFIPHYNGKPMPQDAPISVMVFFFVYALSFVFVCIGLSLAGLDFITSMSGAATSISNVGPGLGPIIGPAGTFQPLPDSAKWILSIAMLLGRLEIFTVLVLFIPDFWRK